VTDYLYFSFRPGNILTSTSAHTKYQTSAMSTTPGQPARRVLAPATRNLTPSRRPSRCQQIAGLYDLEETLGKGHFATVKAARHVFTGEKVLQFTPLYSWIFQSDHLPLHYISIPGTGRMCPRLYGSITFLT